MLEIRHATPDDAEICGRIAYEAFGAINRAHNFPVEFPTPEYATARLQEAFSHPGFYCVTAVRDGKIIGSNCMDERSPISGIGPITVDPSVQNHGVGRALMQAVLDRARERAAPGIRLLQAAYHNRSLSLYAKLGFAAREPVSAMRSPLKKIAIEGCHVRVATETDLAAADRLCQQVHGHNRSGELRDAVAGGSARVVERDGRLTGYASAFGYGGHAVGETNLDLQSLLGSAEVVTGAGVLVPTRNAELFRWCLENGWQVVHPMTLMTIAFYKEPAGAYLPSILY